MQFTRNEVDALLSTATQAAVRAAQQAARRATGFNLGDRVHFCFGASDWIYGTVFELTTHPATGETCAWLRIAGGGFHCEPVANLQHVCGVCPDCRALNTRPGCTR
jgi:hypothetical protein